MDRMDIITGTLGKALGGASGGYTSGRKEIIALLRQRSRPYLFSNTLAPVITAVSLKILEMLTRSTELRDRLRANTAHHLSAMRAAGFDVGAGTHPIVPIMLGEATAAQRMASEVLARGVYAVGFFFPVVPHGKARVRSQVSAAHTTGDLDAAVAAFTAARAAL